MSIDKSANAALAPATSLLTDTPVMHEELAASSGASLVGFSQGGAGAQSRTVQEKLREKVSVFDFLADAQKADVEARTRLIDVTANIQSAIDASVGRELYFPAGDYLISAALTVTLGSLTIACDRGQAQFVLGTENQNGLVIGDGTGATKGRLYRTSVSGFNFVPMSGVSTFSAGACISVNNASYVNIFFCTFYGSDGTTRRLWNGIYIFQGVSVNVEWCTFTSLANHGVDQEGSSGLANWTTSGRIDNCEFSDFLGNGVHFGPFSGGCTINFPIMYSFFGTGVYVDSPGQGNNFIFEPDIEVDNSSNGIIVNQGAVIQIVGGWIGAGTINQSALIVNSGATDVQMMGTAVFGLSTTINGQACSIVGCSIAGDFATSHTGIVVNSTGSDAMIVGCRIKQFTHYGIQFANSPSGCVVSGCHFKNNTLGNVDGMNFNATFSPPVITGCTNDAAYSLTSAASLVLSVGKNMYGVTGSTPNITSMTTLGIAQRVTIQAGAGGITFAGGGNIQLKNSPTTVPSFSTISFVSDGLNWFEDGRNF